MPNENNPYPLLEHAAETLHAASGRAIAEIKLEAAVALLLVAGTPFLAGAAIRASRT